MTRMRALLFRLRTLVRSRQMDRDIDDEIASHLAEATEEYMRQGLSLEDARRAAYRSFGGVTQTKEVYRQVRSFMWLDDLQRDVRNAVRMLRRAPASTAVALLTLALGIGANTAIFSIVNSVLLRPLDYPGPEQLMHLATESPALGLRTSPLSPPEYFELRELNRSFSNVGVYRTREVNLTAGDRPVRVRAAIVDSRLFEVLGVPAEHGRVFTVSETDIPGPPPAPGQGPIPSTPIAILSHELWQTVFDGRSVVGEMVEIEGRRQEIVGVMPAGFDVADNRTSDLVARQAESSKPSQPRPPRLLCRRAAQERRDSTDGRGRVERAHVELGRARRSECQQPCLQAHTTRPSRASDEAAAG